MANPTFGEKKEGVTYKNRYGVYAVIPDANHEKIILVQAPNVGFDIKFSFVSALSFYNSKECSHCQARTFFCM